jgi:hypothetical protein
VILLIIIPICIALAFLLRYAFVKLIYKSLFDKAILYGLYKKDATEMADSLIGLYKK